MLPVCVGCMAASLQGGWEFGMDPLMAHGIIVPLAILTSHFNFLRRKINEWAKVSLVLYPYYTVQILFFSPWLHLQMEIEFSPFGRQWNPFLGSIRIKTCLEMQEWWRWKCWCESVTGASGCAGGDFCGWFLGDVFKIRVRPPSENVSLCKYDLKMSAPEKWMRKDLMKLKLACLLSNRLAAVFCYTERFVAPLVLETKGSIPGSIPDIVASLFTRF